MMWPAQMIYTLFRRAAKGARPWPGPRRHSPRRPRLLACFCTCLRRAEPSRGRSKVSPTFRAGQFTHPMPTGSPLTCHVDRVLSNARQQPPGNRANRDAAEKPAAATGRDGTGRETPRRSASDHAHTGWSPLHTANSRGKMAIHRSFLGKWEISATKNRHYNV